MHMTEQASYNVTAAHITQTPGVCGGAPCIAGRRIRVQHVYVWYELMGMTPDEIASKYDLTLAQIHAALAFAYENIEFIRQEIREEDALVEEMKKRNPSKLKPR